MTHHQQELLPHFYCPELHAPPAASFLVNSLRLQLGCRHSGEQAGDESTHRPTRLPESRQLTN